MPHRKDVQVLVSKYCAGFFSFHIWCSAQRDCSLALSLCWCRKEESGTASRDLAAAPRGDKEFFSHPCTLGWLPWWG